MVRLMLHFSALQLLIDMHFLCPRCCRLSLLLLFWQFVEIEATTRFNDGLEVTRTLMVADLAGSERPASSGAKDEALKEAIEINKGLSVLGNVMRALDQGGDVRIPFVDNSLTRILMPFLTGSARVSKK